MTKRKGAATNTAWTLVIPLKPLALAKSRLTAAAGERLRPLLALAFAQDTVSAALACDRVRDVVVVTDDPLAGSELSRLGARILADTPGAGLNAALTHGAQRVRGERPGSALAALNADLPALRPPELQRALDGAATFCRSFLPDAAGIGTTLLCATVGSALGPSFGGPSRVRHGASGAVELPGVGVASVRRDVDTGSDLSAAARLGLGPHTATLFPAFERIAVARGADVPLLPKAPVAPEG
ncbi:2-phospho-L-lactate guanylyltransferase [Streptomyces sp. NPDC006879]|uniref:2-phospho-L-lactate guanylyltransferase n=1 Tax=Streptomyces sp. NPDC006879 TaxID=3364767 RepID=UPI0036808553